jgi:hypothetical protein
MAHPYHHAISSTRPLGLKWENHFALHDWLDSSKVIFSDARHRSLFHHTTGVYLSKKIFKYIKGQDKISEEHILEDIGFIPLISNWLSEENWPKDLLPTKTISLTDVKGSLLFKNPFPTKTQRQLAMCCDMLLSPDKTLELNKTSPLRFFYFSSAGPFLCQQLLGPLLDGEIPTRSATEFFIQKLWGKIPSHQDIMSQTPIDDWMWKKAKPLSKIL